MWKKILLAFVRYPYLLDALVLIQLVPFAHYLVSLNEYDTLGERLHNPYYWLAFGFTYVCGAGVTGYMKWQNRKLNDRYGIDDDWPRRLYQQLKWNLCVPLLLVVLAVAAYFVAFGENILDREYFSREFPIVAGAVFTLAVLYLGLDLLRYFYDKKSERNDFMDLAAGKQKGTIDKDYTALDTQGDDALTVVNKHGQRYHISKESVGLLQRYHRKTYAYTLDGKLHTVSLPKEELLQWTSAHGAFRASQWFYVMPEAVGGRPVSTGKGVNIPIVPSIRIGKEQGVEHSAGEHQTWICVNKSRAAAARKWCGQITP